jgi:hypothetical protein
MASNLGLDPSKIVCGDNRPGHQPTNPGTCLWSDFYIGPYSDLNAYWVINDRTDPNCYFDIYPRFVGCFAPDTPIRLADGSSLPAKQIRRGMWLWNPTTHQPAQVKKVVAGPEKIPLYEIFYERGKLRVTATHPVMTPNGLRQAKELRAKIDSIYTDDGRAFPITEIRPFNLAPTENVWNFELAGDESDWKAHMVLANGVVSGDLVLQNQREKKPGNGEGTHRDASLH